MKLTPRNWDDFQHYKERRPVWIKLHKNLLDDFDFHCLPVASKALAPLLWLLASEYSDGTIDDHIKKVAFRLRMSEADFVSAIKPLILNGFFAYEDNDASGLLAECLPRDRDRDREETESESEAEAESRYRAAARFRTERRPQKIGRRAARHVERRAGKVQRLPCGKRHNHEKLGCCVEYLVA